MKGHWYIDDIDIYGKYGVGITKGGYNDLFIVPSLKEIPYNEWHECDGIEPDLENPVLNNKSVQISFAAVQKNLINDFIAMISEPGYRNLRITSLNRDWNLRLSDEANIEMNWNSQEHTFVFHDDNPLKYIRNNVKSVGHGLPAATSGYELDGIDLSAYGIVAEQARSEVFRMPTIRSNLERDISVLHSKIVSMLSANMTSKTAALKLCFYCDSIDTFWQNYNAFFYNLIKPGERTLYIKESEEEIPCIYDGSSDFEFNHLNGCVVCKFTLTLRFTVFRIRKTDYLLANERNILMVTEDGINYIDMEVY